MNHGYIGIGDTKQCLLEPEKYFKKKYLHKFRIGGGKLSSMYVYLQSQVVVICVSSLSGTAYVLNVRRVPH